MEAEFRVKTERCFYYAVDSNWYRTSKALETESPHDFNYQAPDKGHKILSTFRNNPVIIYQ